MKKITIALAGNPNAGKTSLFNQLTGSRAHVGNYPGVTVEKKEGYFTHRGQEVHVVDLPGTYSLTAYSMEELVARNFILEERPDLVVDVVDAANLERNLYLAVQFMEIGVPVVIALNMIDVAEERGLKIDLDKLSQLLGTPVVPTVARTKRGLDDLMDTILDAADRIDSWQPRRIRYGPDLDIKIAELTEILGEDDTDPDGPPLRWLAIKALEGDSHVKELIDRSSRSASRVEAVVEEVTRHLKATVDDGPDGVIADHRYGYITSVTKQAVTEAGDLRRTVTDRADLVILNRLLGPIILLGVLYGVYQFTFWISETPVAWSETFFSWLSHMVRVVMPDGPLQSLIASGIIDGVGGVLGFVPLIAFMFFAIAILEDSGYMARIAFIMDRILRTFGLHGSSVVALIVGGGISGGCAVPAVMAARTLRDPKERLATILVTPFMNCGAKLPVFAVLISAFFARHQAHMMFLLTLIAWSMALLAARILRWTILRGEQTPFVMELPPYRMPTLRGLLIHTWERVWQYVKKAGTIILAISIVIWAMMTYPGLSNELKAVFEHQREKINADYLAGPGGQVFEQQTDLAAFDHYLASFDESDSRAEVPETGRQVFPALAQTIKSIEAGQPPAEDLATLEIPARAYLARIEGLSLLENAQAQATLRKTIAGRMGTALEVVTRPLGFDWRTNIALTGGFAAKEVVISTLGTAYSLGESQDEPSRSLSERLAAESGWNPLVAFTLMIFVMMYSPCVATFVMIGREAGWKWAVFATVYTTVAAYFISLAVAWVGRAFGLGI